MTKLNDYWLRTFYLLLSSLQYTPTRDMYFGIFVKTALRVFSNNNVTCIVLWISRSSCIFLDACSVCLQPSVDVVQIGKKKQVTSMSVLLIVEPKCTLAASHAPPRESQWVCRRDRRIDGRTSDRYITLSAGREYETILIVFPLLWP